MSMWKGRISVAVSTLVLMTTSLVVSADQRSDHRPLCGGGCLGRAHGRPPGLDGQLALGPLISRRRENPRVLFRGRTDDATIELPSSRRSGVPQQPQVLGGSPVGVRHAEALTSGQELALVVAAEGGDDEASRKLVEVHMP